MKPSAITLTRPMSAAIVHGTKRIENRPRDLPKAMRGVPTVVAVHAGEKWDDDYMALAVLIETDARERALRGEPGHSRICYESRLQDKGIVGLMRLSGRVFTDIPVWTDQYGAPHTTPWFSGPFGYEIESAVALPHPVPCRGMQGWWPVPVDAIAAMRAQVDRGVSGELADMFYDWSGEVWPCPNCRSRELCRSECPLAPWNDPAYDAAVRASMNADAEDV